MTVAQAALLLWPVITLVLFLSVNRPRAIAGSLIAGYLLLPEWVAFDFPGLPSLDKSTIPCISAFVLALALGRPGEFRWPRSPVVNLLMFVWVFGALLTGLANRDPVVVGSIALTPVSLYGSMSLALLHVTDLLPFVLGAGFLYTEKAHRELLLCFVLAGLVYTGPVLIEIFKGPMFQMLVYGVGSGLYWMQQVRDSGFRAMAFLGHGLMVSAFLAMAVIAALGMWRARLRVYGLPVVACAAYLMLVTLLNKSMGAIILAATIGLALVVLRSRMFLMLALCVTLMIVTYPVLRSSNLVPVERISAAAESISAARAASFSFRLRNEDMLLNRAMERPLLGWGPNGRNRVFVVSSWGSTQDISVTDGTWIITLGTLGWVGYISLFGLLSYPFLHLFKMRRRTVPVATLALAAMLLLNLIDLIPNSSLRPITWLISGALAGYLLPARSPRDAAPTRVSLASRKPEPLVTA